MSILNCAILTVFFPRSLSVGNISTTANIPDKFVPCLLHECRVSVSTNCSALHICNSLLPMIAHISDDVDDNVDDEEKNPNACPPNRAPKLCTLGTGSSLRSDIMYIAVKRKHATVQVMHLKNGALKPTGLELKRTTLSFSIDFTPCVCYIHAQGFTEDEGILYAHLHQKQLDWKYLVNVDKRNIYCFVVSKVTKILYYITVQGRRGHLYRKGNLLKKLYEFSVQFSSSTNDMYIDDSTTCVYWSTNSLIYRHCDGSKGFPRRVKVRSNYMLNLPMAARVDEDELAICKFSGENMYKIVMYNLTNFDYDFIFKAKGCVWVRMKCSRIYITEEHRVYMYDRYSHEMVQQLYLSFEETIVNMIH